MLRLFTLLALLFCYASVPGFSQGPTPLTRAIQQEQAAGTVFQPVRLFYAITDEQTKKDLSSIVRQVNILSTDDQAITRLYRQRPRAIALQLPFEGRELTIDLLQYEVLDPGFKLLTSEGQTLPYQPGVFYRGIVRGSKQSLAAFTILKNKVIALIDSNEDGLLELGQLKDQAGRYALYRNRDLLGAPDFECEAIDPVLGPEDRQHVESRSDEEPAADANSCVKVWLEAENDLVVEKGGAQGAADFLTAVFNLVSTLYQNESINTTISSIFTWTTADPFTSASTSTSLSLFRDYRQANGFTGDLAHLVSRGAPSGGGVAYVNGLCNTYRYAYSWIESSYQQLPVYSWTVNVITHEMGHNLGSRHTHDCVWNGDNTPIDGCGQAAGYTGVGCTANVNAPIPAAGTIMSYCHLVTGVGIDMNLGFGPQPGDLIRSVVAAATCLTGCSGGNCPTVSTSKTDVVCKGAATGSATANPTGGTPPYTYAWSNGATTQTISNLTAGTYSVTVSDGGGCNITASAIVTEPATGMNLSTQVTNASNAGASNGSILLTVVGGAAPYTYAWSNGATTKDISGLAPGAYSVTVTDNSGCTKSASTNVGVGSSGGLCSETYFIYPYSEGFETGFGSWRQSLTDNFNWQIITGKSPNNFGPLSAASGTFYAYVRDIGASGTAVLEGPCFDLSNVINPRLTFAYHQKSVFHTLRAFVVTSSGASTQVWSYKCPQRCPINFWDQASIDLKAYEGQTIRIDFVLEMTASSQPYDVGLDAINFFADQPNCQVPAVNIQKTDVSCNGGSNGSATANVSGGVAPFTYAWSNGATTATINNLSAGTYRVTVTGNDACTNVASVTINQPSALALTLQTTGASSETTPDGAIDLSVSGGTPPYSYAWSNGAVTQDISNLLIGAYTVTVTDNKGCTKTGSATVEVSTACTVTIQPSYNEGFESGLGQWSQASNDDFDWIRRSGASGNRISGPSSAYQGSFYMLASSAGGPLNEAALLSPCIDLTGVSSPSISFAYHMSGATMGSLALQVSYDNGQSWIAEPFAVAGNQGTAWKTTSVSLAAHTGQVIRLRFLATLGNGSATDIAIDAVNISATGGSPAGNVGPATRPEGVQVLSLQPNPANDRLLVRLGSPTETDVELRILDATGRQMQRQLYRLNQGDNTLLLDVAGLHPGLYLLSVEDGRDRRVSKLMIMR